MGEPMDAAQPGVPTLCQVPYENPSFLEELDVLVSQLTRKAAPLGRMKISGQHGRALRPPTGQ